MYRMYSGMSGEVDRALTDALPASRNFTFFCVLHSTTLPTTSPSPTSHQLSSFRARRARLGSLHEDLRGRSMP